jgi:DNA-binding transcriptional LysR family regulator
MDYNLFLVFDAVYTHSNLSRAGEYIGLTQSAVSNALVRLRKVYGDPLFVYTSQGMRPTPYARKIAPSVKQALELLDRTAAQHQPKFDPLRAERTFHLAMTDYGSSMLLPPLLEYLASHGPHISCRIHHLVDASIIKALEMGEVDLSFSSQMKLGAGFHAKVLYRDRFVCMVRTGHPQVGSSISLEQFLALQHVMYAPQEGRLGKIDRILAGHRRVRRIGAHVPHVQAIPSIVAATDLLAVVPERFGRTVADPGRFRLLEPPIPIPGFDMKQCWCQIVDKDPANRWLRSVLVELTRRLPPI